MTNACARGWIFHDLVITDDYSVVCVLVISEMSVHEDTCGPWVHGRAPLELSPIELIQCGDYEAVTMTRAVTILYRRLDGDTAHSLTERV